LKLRHNLKIPAVGLMTDYTCSPFWEETRLEKYIIPAKELLGEFRQKGLPLEKLVPIGIPVNSRFKKKTPKHEARSVFGITASPVFVIMGGSMGYGKIEKMARALHKRLPDAQIVAVCGNNRKLFEKLQCIKNVKPLGYIDNVDVLMDAADVLLTKPGGLSASEALTKRIPLVFTCPIPGGEEQNAKFLSSHRLCLSCKSVEKAAEAACGLLLNPRKANRMVSIQDKIISRDIDKKIGDFIISNFGEKHLTET
jgi:processive 1,2-diacylglycerol beta-glucosyltransferase